MLYQEDLIDYVYKPDESWKPKSKRGYEKGFVRLILNEIATTNIFGASDLSVMMDDLRIYIKRNISEKWLDFDSRGFTYYDNKDVREGMYSSYWSYELSEEERYEIFNNLVEEIRGSLLDEYWNIKVKVQNEKQIETKIEKLRKSVESQVKKLKRLKPDPEED